ncbi:MAG: VirB4 family type IV secretion/conjugal transfer ATPase [Proteobacteria bacterium]|nr:VirB4 family type IV secretion/conjugal transfer ATPase [Pseudomonadota bacterium]
MRSLTRRAAVRREREAAEHIPYTTHVSEHVVATANGDFLCAFRLGGKSFESADDQQLNTWHEQLNLLWRNVACPQLALWTHLVRRAHVALVPPPGRGQFAQRLTQRYARRMAAETLMVNELYLAVLYRPAAGLAAGTLSRLLSRTRPEDLPLQLRDALDRCAKLTQTLHASLARYEPEVLGTYRQGDAWYSSLLEYLALLVNGESQPVRLPAGPIRQALVSTRLLFGSEAIEYRLAGRSRAGAMLGIKEYPSPSYVGMYNRLLAAPFPLVLTQSCAFLSRGAAQSLLQRQHHRMHNAGDFAVSQAQQLTEALDGLASGGFVMGDHHFSLQVLAELPPPDSEGSDAWRLKALNDNVALARNMLADTGMAVAREDLGLEAAFWAQLPGNFALRPRKAPITSRNFAAMAPFHNYPQGRASGNHWGEALALLCTAARSPYYFSLHASSPADGDGGRKDTGHTFICGPTGSGKTALIGFLMTMLDRQDATQVIFDKDRGLEVLVRALGGEYFQLCHGVPTGFNPLQLPDGGQHLEFLRAWLQLLVRPADGRGLSARQHADLEQALRGTLALELSARRLSRLVEFLDPTDPEGLYARLARWCECTRGEYAWVFDNAADRFVDRIAALRVAGFDVTDFLDREQTRTPITLYIFHLVRGLLDGRRLVCWMDEFWRLLGDAAFAQFAKDGPKTWRKLNGVMCLATQSASDVLGSPISRTIVEQTPTKIYFPNSDADPAEYMQGLGLSEREFRLIREQLQPGARMFLVKQGQQSAVCRLDLKGCEAELAVLAGGARHLQVLHELMARLGPQPQQWLDDYLVRVVPDPLSPSPQRASLQP